LLIKKLSELFFKDYLFPLILKDFPLPLFQNKTKYKYNFNQLKNLLYNFDKMKDII